MNPLKAMSSRYLRESHAVHMRAQSAPLARQERRLGSLRRLTAGTALEERTGFGRVRCYRDYVRNVAPATWKDYEPLVERVDSGEPRVLFNDRPRAMALTSGTTGYLNKPIPYNQAMLEAFRSYQFLVAASMAANCPGANPVFDWRFGYSSSQVRGGAPGKSLPRVYTSTVLTTVTPAISASRFLPGHEVLAIRDWGEKLDAIARRVEGKDVRIVTGIPIYMTSIFEHIVASARVSALAELWPNLEVFFYSGSHIELYRERIEALVGKRLSYLAGYIATEGPLGFPVDDSGLMAFHLDHFLFTFLPASRDEDTVLGLDELERGGEYEVLLGMPNGFLQYRTGDVVRIEGVSPHVTFRFVGRREATVNLGHEKVSLPQLNAAFARVCREQGFEARHFFLCPSLREDAKPRYLWTLLTDAPLSGREEAVARALDSALMAENPNYEDSRLRDALIDAPVVRVCPESAYRALFERGRDRGQFKMKNVLRSEAELEVLLASTFPA